MQSTFHWHRVVSIALVLAVTTLIFAIAPIVVRSYASYVEARLDPIPATQSEQEAILEAIIEANNFDGLPSPPPMPGETSTTHGRQPFMFIDRSIIFCDSAERDSISGQDCDDHSGWKEIITSPFVDRRIPKKLRLELLSVNQHSSPNPVAVSSLARYANRKQIRDVLQKSDGWKGFYEQYPGTAGYVEASWSAVTPDRKHALVYVMHGCDNLCGTGDLYFLGLAGGRWKIEVTGSIWQS